MTRLLTTIAAALLYALPLGAAELGDDGLHKTPWMRDTFKDLAEDLEEANAEGKRLPYYIRRRDGDPLVFAGLWQTWGQDDGMVETCAIVTCAANRTMSAIHHRMPVILSPGDWALWLGEEGKGAATLMQPAPDEVLEAWRVDPAVNSNRASGAALIEPVQG